ncbi:hypothetical protein [Amycolatopsis plumensis]|uniref:Uncharacterized protein n=1 Tax=Amycolatopsis plumensis TaxID=236508 RepID=A0ABV5UBA3_9PSEU
MNTEAALIILAITAAIGVTLAVAAFAPTRPRLADVLHERPQKPAPWSRRAGRPDEADRETR